MRERSEPSQQSQPRSSTAAAAGFEPADRGSIPRGASNFHQKFVRATLLFTAIGVWMIAGLLFAMVGKTAEQHAFINIKLQNIEDLLAEQNQLMEFNEEEYNEYCAENPEDCEETF